MDGSSVGAQNVKFQFHKGTIKTKVLLALGYNLSNFNSIKVQLRRNTIGQRPY